MAATLTPDDELTRVAFASIEKWEEDPADGTLYVYGKATTPEVDTDEQVVASAFTSMGGSSCTRPAMRLLISSMGAWK